MNRGQLIEKVATETKLTKALVERILDSAIDNIKAAVKGNDSVRIAKFGTFKQRKRQARVGVNPRNGNKMNIPEKSVPKFTVSKHFFAKQ